MIASFSKSSKPNVIAIGVLVVITALLNLQYFVEPYVPRGDGYRIPHHLSAISQGDQTLISSWNSFASLGFPAMADPERMYELSWFMDLDDSWFRLKLVAFLCFLQLSVICSLYHLMRNVYKRSTPAALFGSLTLFATYAITITFNGRPTVAYEFLAVIWMIYCYEKSFTAPSRIPWLAVCILIVGLGIIYRPTNVAAISLIVMFVIGLADRVNDTGLNIRKVLYSVFEPILIVLFAAGVFSAFTMPMLDLNPSTPDLVQRYSFSQPISTYLTFALPSIVVFSFLFQNWRDVARQTQVQKIGIILVLSITGTALYSVYFPAPEFRMWLFENLPLVKHLRNPFFLVTVFSVTYAILVAYAFDQIAQQTDKRISVFQPVIVVLLAVFVFNGDKILLAPLQLFTDPKVTIEFGRHLGSITSLALLVYLILPSTRLRPESVKTYLFAGLGAYLLLLAIPGLGVTKSEKNSVSALFLRKPIAIKYAYREQQLQSDLVLSRKLADQYPAIRVLGEGLYAPVTTVPKFSNHLSKETRWYLSNLFNTVFPYPRSNWVQLWLKQNEPERFIGNRYKLSQLDWSFLTLGNIGLIKNNSFIEDGEIPNLIRSEGHYLALKKLPQMYRLFSDFSVEQDEDRIAAAIRRDGPISRVYLEKDPGFLPTSNNGLEQSVKINNLWGNTISFEISSNREALLFVPDAYVDGWVGQVNGNTAEILRANFAFRAVKVPKGNSNVTMKYELPNGPLYKTITQSGILILLLIIFTTTKAIKISLSNIWNKNR